MQAASKYDPFSVLAGNTMDEYVQTHPTFRAWLQSEEGLGTCIGTEKDVVIRTFGEPCEGFTMGKQHQAVHALMQERFIARLRLAICFSKPDGYDLVHRVLHYEPQVVRLVSPPEMIVTTLENGTVVRRDRDDQVDGEPWMDDEQWQSYLETHRLPAWFLSADHKKILSGREDGGEAEAGVLGINFKEVWRSLNAEAGAQAQALNTQAEIGDEEVEEDASDEQGVQGHSINQIDKSSGLRHDPTNQGRNNQKGIHGRAFYQTRSLAPKGAISAAKVCTVDRSRAHVGQKEDHKAFICSKYGEFRSYKNWDKIDWDSSASVEPLNRWRAQEFERAGWPKMRDEKREPYSGEQRDWLEAKVMAKPGHRFTQREAVVLATEFNAEFQDSRGKNGIWKFVHGVRQRLEQENHEESVEESV